MSSKMKELEELLMELTRSVKGILAAVIVDSQGLPISSIMPQGIEEELIAAMTATILSVSQNALKELGQGTIEKIMVEGDNGSLILRNAGENAILAVLVDNKSNIGLIFYALKKFSKRIESVLS
ncbi:MAG: roadblock/LC7 domain-containing protein [Candidatus Odinarchaeota archaeon]|nr:roadblock/LC7 domain-containing protein [Candidatus Odinarchaeota archaeon]